MSLIHRLNSQSAQFDAELRTLLAYEASEDASIEHACAEILHRKIQHSERLQSSGDGVAVAPDTDSLADKKPAADLREQTNSEHR